ncbi:MAG: nuclear transport factor 2 family protein [Allosphingosinicella sp.]|uniref:nuclear transport factor 2 family protein n=1 Tax=Allosphingosinicella sp. TaxID=2823234 RepID=UPI00394261CB
MLDADLPINQVADAYRTWRESRGSNVDEVIDMMADEVEMRSVLDPGLPDDLAADRKTREEARQYFEVLSRDWEMIDYPQEKIVANGDTVVWIGRCHWRHKASGREINSPKVDIWTFRDGKAVKFMEMFDSLGFASTVGLV